MALNVRVETVALLVKLNNWDFTTKKTNLFFSKHFKQ